VLRAFLRAVAAGAAGAAAGVLLLLPVYGSRAGLALEMNRDLPAFTSGFHPIERDGDRTFVWTSGRAVVRLAGVDRRTDWTCTVHVRGARGPEQPMPSLTLIADDGERQTVALDNEFRDVAITFRARPAQPGLTLAAEVAPVFVPGPGDPRTLGAQVDWLRCDPAGRARPPSAVLAGAALATGAIAAAAALAGAPFVLLLAATAVMAAGVVTLLVTGNGAFGAYPSQLASMALVAAVALVVAAWLPWLRSRAPLSRAAVAAVAMSATIACLKLAALSHPAKPIVDAVFQAHRLGWVLAGRYFFTQPLPDGVQFPYAIGLYVVAAPWASVVTDHVLLLRAVVVVAEAMAGLLLYAVVVRGFGDRLAALLAVVLFHVVPIPFVVIGNANLTNAFAQAVAVMALAAVALAAPDGSRSRRAMSALLMMGATALAFLSHVGTIVALGGVLATTALAYLVFGGRSLRRPAVTIIGAALVAAVLAVGVYYRHFDEVIDRFVERVRATESAAVIAPDVPADAPAVLVRPLTWAERAADAARQTVAHVGWPVLALAGVGAWRVWRSGWRGPVPLVVLAWVAAWVGMSIAGTLTRVDTQYQRYAAEFIGRIALACYPAAAILGGLGAAALWRARARHWQIAALVLMAAAVAAGIGMWRAWLA